jgi:hypothetical protein
MNQVWSGVDAAENCWQRTRMQGRGLQKALRDYGRQDAGTRLSSKESHLSSKTPMIWDRSALASGARRRGGVMYGNSQHRKIPLDCRAAVIQVAAVKI